MRKRIVFPESPPSSHRCSGQRHRKSAVVVFVTPFPNLFIFCAPTILASLSFQHPSSFLSLGFSTCGWSRLPALFPKWLCGVCPHIIQTSTQMSALSDPCKRHSLHHISGLSLAFTLFHCCYDFCYFIFFGVFPDIWNILLFLLMGLLPTCIRIQLDNNEVSLSFLCYLQYLEQCLTQGIGAEVIVWLWSWMD